MRTIVILHRLSLFAIYFKPVGYHFGLIIVALLQGPAANITDPFNLGRPGVYIEVGAALGAEKPTRAEKSGWLAIGLCECLMILCVVAILIWPEMIVKIFNSEPEFLDTGSVFLRIGAAGFLMMGFALTYMHILSGVGDTFPPMLIAILTTWGVLIPLAIILPRISNLGAYGVRWAIVASLFASAVAYFTYFKTGRWKMKRV